MAKKSTYDASSISVLEGLEAESARACILAVFPEKV